MTGRLRILITAVVLFAFLVTGLPMGSYAPVAVELLGPSAAMAQKAKKKKRRGLFSILFGRRSAKKKQVKVKKSRRAKRKTVRKRKKRSSSKSSTKKVAKVAAVPKAEDAKVVLVIGDFFADDLAEGLSDAYAAYANLKVVDKSKGLSGLVRADVMDWAGQLPKIIEETKPSHIVSILGANDRQTLRTDAGRLKRRTPEWDKEYTKRVEALGLALKATKIPYTWVGLPPVRPKSMIKDFLYFNDLYGKAARANGGNFVDVWDGFSDEEGNYSRSGPDVDGQIVLLRPKDGINLTRAGKRRLAFYIQQNVQRAVTGDGLFINPGLAFDLDDNLPKSATYDPERTGKTIVIRLDDPSVDGSETLIGETIKLDGGLSDAFEVKPEKTPKRTVQKLGRVDNYTWPPQQQSPAATIPAVASAAQRTSRFELTR